MEEQGLGRKELGFHILWTKEKPIPLNRDQKNDQKQTWRFDCGPQSANCSALAACQPSNYPVRPAVNDCGPHSYNWHDPTFCTCQRPKSLAVQLESQ